MSILQSTPLHLLLQCLLTLFIVQTFVYHFPTLTLSSNPFPTPTDLFKTHPFCMCLGLMLCFHESVLLFQPVYSLPKRRWIHYGLNTTGTVLASVGVAAILYKKEMDQVDHFLSWHGTFGIVTFTHAISQFSVGWVLLIPENRILSALATKKTLKYLHRVSGCLLLFEIFAVFVLSCYTSWFAYVSQFAVLFYANIWFYAMLTVVSIGLVFPKLTGKKSNVRETKKR